VFGELYVYPRSRYGDLLRTGERFVYYRGRRGTRPGDLAHAYLGVGVIGPLGASDPEMGTAEIRNCRLFDRPLYFKDAAGNYYEDVPRQAGSTTGTYFRGRSVRPVGEDAFRRIMEAATASAPLRPPAAGGGGRSDLERTARYPTAERAAEIDAAGIEIAKGLCRDKWPGTEVDPMPHNNPGFDILVRTPMAPTYVEVKSSSGPEPRFFISERERMFADANAAAAHLLVICGIDPESGTYSSVHWHSGPLTEDLVDLTPYQWRGILRGG
jgi:hypothetical protein